MFNLILLLFMILSALWAVMSRSLLKATVGLAVTSAILTIIMFNMDSPLAAVFELSVCTGLITVVFMSTISLTRVLTHQEILTLSKDRVKRFWFLPVIVVLAGIVFSLIKINFNIQMPEKIADTSVQDVLWNDRQLDLFGQIIILLVGVFGVVILFKERKKHE